MNANLRNRVKWLESFVMEMEFSGRVFGVFDTPNNQKRITEIENRGGEVFRLRLPPVGRLDNEIRIVEIAKRLNEFDWIFFSDIHCVDIFIEVLEANKIEVFGLDDLTVCAFGEAVADRLRFSQVHSDVIPSNLKDNSVLQSVEEYIVDTELLKRSSVLFLRRSESKQGIVEMLRAKVSNVEVIDLYRVDTCSEAERVKLVTLLRSGAIDEFIFRSVEEVESLEQIISPDLLEEVLGDAISRTNDSNAFQSLSELNIRVRQF